MNFKSLSYANRLEYLLWYTAEDWLELSIVVDAANRVLGPEANDAEIEVMTLKLAGDLIDSGAPPGDLAAGEPSFIPWMGNKEEQLQRIKNEIDNLDRLPHPAEICWFFNKIANAERKRLKAKVKNQNIDKY